MRNLFFFLVCLILALQSSAQKIAYSTANAHSHNDYENRQPFWEAWKAQFGSIEADIFLHAGKLVVAHDSAQLARQWTLDSLYLQPLQECIRSNNGSVYRDRKRVLQLMIDIKSDSVATLRKLMEAVQRFPLLTTTPTLQIVISGNRPAPDTYASYPQWILFDGELHKEYTAGQLERIPMLSGNFKKFATWKGEGRLTAGESAVIRSLIAKAHRHKKKIRFWNAPDNLTTWQTFMKAGVDYLNTDRIGAIRQFLNRQRNK
ncbi:MAG: phosphatidylinositol-specific phospholipase C/glycerophosphodiester phosphodiesterase family protein [Bacteroidota bacterium]|nr:phosphatidylinositol-specific phospholipase C/glycerophosphodiester phosphodiesterase family protein [Bacteroidota bacterium]